jgi:hypothetical protein
MPDLKSLAIALALFLPGLSRATSLLPATSDQQMQADSGIFRGTVVEVTSYREPADGQIYTRTLIQVEEAFKGSVPKLIRLIHRGGTVGTIGEVNDFAPQFKVGEERLLSVSRRGDGSLFASRGEESALKLPTTTAQFAAAEFAAGQNLLQTLRNQTVNGPISGSDLTDQSASLQPTPQGVPTPLAFSSATNLLLGSDGIPARFILPDRGEPVPYLIDADSLPAGMTLTQAVSAVKAALGAWTNVTSLRYVFAGFQSFGMASANVNASDGVLRIQLHDNYHYIGGGGGNGDTLGVGGHAWSIFNLSAGWTTGGNVIGNDFHKVVAGYVVLSHTNVFMQNINNFTEVLTHEIGHTIGLAHSSQNPGEPNTVLKQAIMYYLAHGDGRGAALNAYDINVSRQVHPPTNTPPYCYDRVIDAVTSPNRPINLPGLNSVQVRGYDLQTTNLTFATTDASAGAGTFSIVNNNITFVPNDWYSDSPRVDPANTFSYYDVIYARYSDGVNAAAYAAIRVVSLFSDTYSEGLPDSWRATYFGSSNPSAGSNRHPNDDFDHDGYSNLQEWLMGSNPADATSNLRITSFNPTNIQWQARGYEVYELCSSTNLTNWVRAINPIVPTNFVPGTDIYNLNNAIGAATTFTNGSPKQFFRVRKVP